MCDSDEHCKGYVKNGDGCQLATTSFCQTGCDKYNNGTIGPLVADSNYYGGCDYRGCFIKNMGT